MYTKFQLILSDKAIYYFIFIQFRDIDHTHSGCKNLCYKMLVKINIHIRDKNKSCLLKF